MKTPRTDWYKRFKSKACILKMKAESKDEALDEVAAQITSSGLVTEELGQSIRLALHEREALASTGVGMNVAIPHIKIEGLTEAVCSLAVCKDGLEWRAVDGAPVNILFTVIRPDGPTEGHDPEDHLEMMRWIAKLARDSDFRAFAMQAKTKPQLVGLLKEMSSI
ncbi:MAG: PTS sugar transporter subunit IIA [Planctomycetota bacterium]|nr:PTS sugar transporter subunit IIA [Planctomycetota bacterium]MDG1983671.1 PTS sugar transporter subunit IIA [Planctomycetota bacterium]